MQRCSVSELIRGAALALADVVRAEHNVVVAEREAERVRQDQERGFLHTSPEQDEPQGLAWWERERLGLSLGESWEQYRARTLAVEFSDRKSK